VTLATSVSRELCGSYGAVLAALKYGALTPNGRMGRSGVTNRSRPQNRDRSREQEKTPCLLVPD
jgi:hypothetical protein